MGDRQFHLYFRMLPETFEHLLIKMNEISENNLGKGHPELLLEKQLMIALWYFRNHESFRYINIFVELSYDEILFRDFSN